MCSTTFMAFHPPLIHPETVHQNLYYRDDHPTMPNWFKGMAVILKEHGLYPAASLNVQCEGFKCVVGAMSCCCRCAVFSQPDFASQKLALEELITSCGHICNFYPKYHCETNFIEMYWGAAKLQYHLSLKTTNMDKMQKNVQRCLDDVLLLQVRR